eukprot:COSAG01_NODE_2388_length_7779_cov_127.916384_8_plen_174_part_00
MVAGWRAIERVRDASGWLAAAWCGWLLAAGSSSKQQRTAASCHMPVPAQQRVSAEKCFELVAEMWVHCWLLRLLALRPPLCLEGGETLITHTVCTSTVRVQPCLQKHESSWFIQSIQSIQHLSQQNAQQLIDGESSEREGEENVDMGWSANHFVDVYSLRALLLIVSACEHFC